MKNSQRGGAQFVDLIERTYRLPSSTTPLPAFTTITNETRFVSYVMKAPRRRSKFGTRAECVRCRAFALRLSETCCFKPRFVAAWRVPGPGTTRKAMPKPLPVKGAPPTPYVVTGSCGGLKSKPILQPPNSVQSSSSVYVFAVPAYAVTNADQQTPSKSTPLNGKVSVLLIAISSENERWGGSRRQSWVSQIRLRRKLVRLTRATREVSDGRHLDV